MTSGRIQGAIKMELIRSKKQKVWGWPGVVNFTLGGMAGGFYLLSSLLMVLRYGMLGLSQPAGFKLVAPALMGLGFLALTTEAGHPLRARYLLRYLRRSWMSRETLAGALFVPAAALDWLFPHPALWGLAAAAALGLMFSHGFIVYCVRGVTAWNVPLVPFLFLSSGFSTGGGLVLLAALGGLALGVGPVVICLICALLDLAVWLLFLHGPHDLAFREATGSLRRPKSLLFTVGIGHLLPALSLLLLLVLPGVGLWHIFAALAGVAIIAGGVGQKVSIILKAGYLRGLVLEGLQSDARGVHPVFPLSLPVIHQGGCTE
jgi:DMSO reductase anchor subunit